jgi:endonuclease-8
MPEGDTIARTARTLGAVLAGKVVTAFSSTEPSVAAARLVGRTILAVEPYGKHLFIRFDDGRALHTHMRMTGSWHLYRPGDRWKRPAHRAKVVIEVAGAVAVCFDAPFVRLRAAGPAAIEHLGPDILAEPFDVSEALRRLRTQADTPLGGAILDQRVVAGIGNIYKSETLFLCHADPRAHVSRFNDAELGDVLQKARRLMRLNAAPNARMRSTRPGGPTGRYWVYRRSGEPCFVCGTIVKMERQGDDHRSTYFCPRCQPARG